MLTKIGNGKSSRDGSPRGRSVGINLLRYFYEYFLGIRPGVNIGYGNRNIFGLAPGWGYVASMGRSYDIRGRKYLGIISVNRWRRRVK